MLIYTKCNSFYKLIIIFFLFIQLIIIYYFCKKFENFKILKNQINKSYLPPAIHNYKLYDEIENPLISMVLNFSNIDLYLINDELKHFIKETLKFKIIDIQILILLKSFKEFLFYNSSRIFLKERRINSYTFNKTCMEENLIALVKLIKGKFLIFFDKLINLKYSELNKIFNTTKGSIENVLDIKIQNNQTFYLIRTKILKDILDSGKTFQNFNEIIKFIKSLSIPKITYIPIAFCPDNFYTPLTYNSMLSILISKTPNTYISFYLIISMDFKLSNMDFIETLYEQFEYFNITYIKMDNRYEKAYTNRYLTKNAFFRLSLGELLPNLNKLIYLDSDTICLKDLSNLYNFNFMGKIFLGKILIFDPANYNFELNTGILLLNLFEMRKIKIEKQVLTLLNNGFKDPVYHDQAIINKYFKKYIGFLPLEFNVFPLITSFMNQETKGYNGLYDYDSIYFSYKNPSIKHFPGIPKEKIYHQEDWYYFARKSKYFKKISDNFSDVFDYNL